MTGVIILEVGPPHQSIRVKRYFDPAKTTVEQFIYDVQDFIKNSLVCEDWVITPIDSNHWHWIPLYWNLGVLTDSKESITRYGYSQLPDLMVLLKSAAKEFDEELHKC